MLIDPIGLDPEFFVPDERFVVHTPLQKIDLRNTYYKESFKIFIIDSANKIELIENKDYTISSDNIDSQARGEALLYKRNFGQTLIKSISIKRQFISDYVVAWEGQTLYKKNLGKTFVTEEEKTQEIIDQIVDELGDIRNKLYGTPETNLELINSFVVLEEDLHKTNPGNYITNEPHIVNTQNSKSQLIMPTAGGYFSDSLEVRIKDTNQLLVEHEHYIKIRIDLELTAKSNSKDTIKWFVLFTANMNTEIILNYHAVGGKLTMKHFRLLAEAINSQDNFIRNSNFITDETLDDVPVFESINSRIRSLETTMRRLLLEKTASYTDVSQDTGLLLKVQSPDNNIHWYSIAELYKVDGSDTVSTFDQCTLRIAMANTKLLLTTMISVNLYAENEEDIFKIVSWGDNIPKHYVDYEYYADVLKRVNPMFRIIYNRQQNPASGVVLQIGLELNDFTSEQIAIESQSGKESCWKLRTEPANTIGPENNTYTLPSGQIWDIDQTSGASSVSLVYNKVYPNTEGLLVYGSNVGVDLDIFSDTYTPLPNALLPDYLILKDVKYAMIYIHDSTLNEMLTCRVDFPIGLDSKIGVGFFGVDALGRQVHLKLIDDIIQSSIEIESDLATEDVNRFYLKQILLFY